MKTYAGTSGYPYLSNDPSSLYKTEIPVPAEQFEQIVGNVKIVLSKAFATIFTVSNALPPPKPKIISAS